MNPEASLQNQLFDLFIFLGAEWVLELLVILSIISVAITIERLVHFFRYRGDLTALQENLESSLAKGDIEQAKSVLSGEKSHVAQVSLMGLQAMDRGPGAVEEVMQGATKIVRLKLERGLAFLGTLGNNAPFIGLFGTVLGIIRAFRDLAANSSEGTEAVMAGIAEALVATAVGLLVALPAVAIFNLFQRSIRRQIAIADAVGHTVLSYAKSSPRQS